MHTTSTGAAAPQQAISLSRLLESDASPAAARELPHTAFGAGEAHVALEARHDRLSLNAVFEALEQERQRHADAHPRDLLGALLESHNLRLSHCLVHDVLQAAGHANPPCGTTPADTPTARLARVLAEPNPSLEGTLRARLARVLAERERPQAAGTTTAAARLLEQAAHLAARPGACPSLVSAMEQGLAAMPADLQAAWLAEWLSWPQPPAGIQDNAMALIHSGQLSDAARTNLLAKITVRNLMSSPANSPAALHPL
ncbi:hypothetical protein [Cupriavidus gilardii]|uniref:hypothetical protein n=1 Tax=Cupriavidus gilardii TaxID=82541 RepID=UPI0015803759|nr:hypothetical protein [Cupriavidus gilardii]MCT9071860.1 hypothetical protein [Cupriavidus gilardii]QKS63666.1 hypothetical protein FOB47_17495 [Cupriavidus gilardii]